METEKKSTRKADNKGSEKNIKDAYVQHILTHGERPPSVYKFCLDMGIREDDFYNFFGSFDGLEQDIWKGFITKTIARLRGDESFKGFSAREKVLALYYTLLEELRHNRSYVLVQLEHPRKIELVPHFIRSFKTVFEGFITEILNEGKGKGEVANRPLLDKRYPQLFWMHLGFILHFWKEDNSAGFEKTDAAIEKSVTLAFDLIGKGAVDSALDFGKFLFQNRQL